MTIAPTMPAVRTIALSCLERLDALDITGAKRRTDAALHFFSGAAGAALMAGDEPLHKHLATVLFFISVQGMNPVLDCASTVLEEPANTELVAFREEHGKRWKTVLADCWMRGEPVPGYPSLYGLRNQPTYGPAWLDRHPQ